MSSDLSQPNEAAVRHALVGAFPDLAREPVEFLGNGWAFWAYRCGHIVLRFPRDEKYIESLAVEAAVMRELAPTLPLPVSAIELHGNASLGLIFTAHRHVPGVSVVDLQRPLGPEAGSTLGRFLRAMHSFPIDRALELGLPNASTFSRKAALEAMGRDMQERVFPLVSPDAKRDIGRRFEGFLNDDSNFNWQPVVSHADLDDWNVLADPHSGELSGVIDWGDIAISDPAGDFTGSLYGGFATRGIRLQDLLAAYGISEVELESMRPRCAFYAYCWPLHEILYGFESQQEDVVAKGIEFLYEALENPALTQG